MIREAIALGAGLYVALIFYQALVYPPLGGEALVIGIVLIGAAACYLSPKHDLVHRVEAIALWGAVLLFALYAALKIGGVL
ncbi:MAG: hypothetical protein NT074_06675 [Methanomicrobiales archaeon]|nr:hypothetical protein [Methanomicrobiales archaeon]